jgi:hypothetical protein
MIDFFNQLKHANSLIEYLYSLAMPNWHKKWEKILFQSKRGDKW